MLFFENFSAAVMYHGQFHRFTKETFYTNGINDYTCEVFMYNFASGVNFRKKNSRELFLGIVEKNTKKSRKIRSKSISCHTIAILLSTHNGQQVLLY